MRLTGKQILIFAGPLYEELELWYPRLRLEEEGARVTVAGTGESEYRGQHGYPVRVDGDISHLRPADYDGLVIPGGYAPDVLRRSERVLQMTRELFHTGKPVGIICHAGWVAISAGIVRGRRGTSFASLKDDLVNAGLIWENSPVVVDGNLISSRSPLDLPQFMRAMIEALSGNRSGVSLMGPAVSRRS